MKNKCGGEKPTGKLNLTSSWIGSKKIDRKFRQIMTEMLGFWAKNKKKRNLLLPSEFYDAVLRCKGIKLFERLKTRRTVEEDQEIQAYHRAKCEPQLRKVLADYHRSKKKGARKPPSRKRCI